MRKLQTNKAYSSQRVYSKLFQNYWLLVKSPQTLLLLSTGLAGYMSAKCPVSHWTTLFTLAGSLFLAISGSTILNMWFDRDIDAKMERTKKRPLPSGLIKPESALFLGLLFSFLGVGWALHFELNYGLVVLAGLIFDVLVYTIWLKRKTAWSIVWGGVSGGMPILAGRVLGTGKIEWVGIVLALSVLFWIPTHIMTFNIRNLKDYNEAGIPTFAAKYGISSTRKIIAISSILSAVMIGVSTFGLGITLGYLRIVMILSTVLIGMALFCSFKPTEKLNYSLFKYASIYMLCLMLLISV